MFGSGAALGAPQEIDEDRRQKAFLGVPVLERNIEVQAALGQHFMVFGVGDQPMRGLAGRAPCRCPG